MKFVEFYDTRDGRMEYLGEVRLEGDKLVMSQDLTRKWPRESAYRILGREGYITMYDPEKILESLPDAFIDPEFLATDVKTR
jgi:hypothetical protein